MYTKKQLYTLYNGIDKAQRVFRKAVEANLKQLGTEVEVVGCDNGMRVHLSNFNTGEDFSLLIIDKVRWNKKLGRMECHIRYQSNIGNTNEWMPTIFLDDWEEHVLNAIKWQDKQTFFTKLVKKIKEKFGSLKFIL